MCALFITVSIFVLGCQKLSHENYIVCVEIWLVLQKREMQPDMFEHVEHCRPTKQIPFC